MSEPRPTCPECWAPAKESHATDSEGVLRQFYDYDGDAIVRERVAALDVPAISRLTRDLQEAFYPRPGEPDEAIASAGRAALLVALGVPDA